MSAREVITYWLLCFVSIFAVVNPFRATTVLALLSESWTPKERAQATHRAILVSAAILFVAGWIGNHILLRSGIHLGGFRIASGLLLLATVIPDMVRNRPLTRWTEQYADAKDPLRLGVAPLAIPLLCSAGSVATVTLYSGEITELWRRVVTLSTLGLTLLIAFVMMRLAPKVHALLGELGSRFVGHAMNLTVAAWAVDFIAVGVRDLLPLVLGTPPAGG